MPIYEYQCTACDHIHEALQKMSDSLLVNCPECKKPTLKKKLSAAAFKLKGQGWYATDFKDKGKKPVAKTNSETKTSHQKNCTTNCACK